LWLAFFVVEAIWGISPFLETAGNVIWAIFWIDFAIKFTLSPDKLAYLRSNWLTVVALALPALRVFRAFRAFRLLRAARAARGIRLVRLLTSLNRGMRALGSSFGRRGFGYVLALTTFVLFAGAAAMYSFENEAADGMRTYSDALWWTAMLLTTMGSDYFPRTAEGRMLCLILAVYGFAVFGYVTATLASYFLSRDAEETTEPTLRELKEEIAQLRQMLVEKQLQG
jgi:voltage-gated potassium channel